MIFYFLWGDTLFAESLEQLHSYVDQPVIESRRELVLTALDGCFETLACEESEHRKTHERFLQSHRHLAKAYWTILKLREHVPAGVWTQIKIDLAVNEIDPDFSFVQALDEAFGQKSGL